MRIVLKTLTIAIALLFLTSCATKHSEIIVADYGVNKLTLGEFEAAYAKNVGGIEAAMQDSLQNYKDFLNLYVIYKMKLRDAFVRGFHNDEELIAELNKYKGKVGVSFIEEKQIVVPGLRTFYDQRSEEVRVSHLMIKKNPNPIENLEKIEAILDSIQNGVSFEDMVVKYSEDNFSKTKGGDIYWFTAGQIVPSFEYASFETPVGEVHPNIVETKFGYHILKVTDRANRRYKINAKHILVRGDEPNGNIDGDSQKEKPFEKAVRIRAAIIDGAKFDSLAIKYSDDPSSGAKGGDLGFFGRRQMVQPFDEAVFKLEIGELSEIVKTRFGYHIIKLVDELEYPPYEEELKNIRELYKKSRFDFDYARFIDGLKKDFQFELNDAIVNTISSENSGITLSPEFISDKLYIGNKNEVVFTIANESFSVEDLFAYLETQEKFRNKVLKKPLLIDGINDFSTNALLTKKALELEKEDEEFANLMKDYKRGIFIFKLQEDEVWNQVKIDSTKLREIFNNSKDDFVFKGKVNFSEIFSNEENKINELHEKLVSGESFDSLAAQYTERSGFKLKSGLHGYKDVDYNELSKKAFILNSKNDFSKPFALDKGWSIVTLNNRIAERPKTFEEAFPQLSSLFQESESKRLENEYVNRLKKLYDPELFFSELVNAFQQQKK